MVWLIILSVLAFPVNATQIATTYIITESSTPNALTVTVTRNKTSSDTQLILRGISIGISEQIQNLMCDGKQIKKNKPGIWSIPANCQNIQWQVPLLKSGAEIAGAQQSLKSGDFILFSEASSLPRLKDATSEMVKLSIPTIKTIFPAPSSPSTVSLPNNNSAPLFLILNSTIAGTDTSDSIKLTYLLNDAEAISKLPNMTSHMKGLQWLNTVIPGKTKEDFTLAWLGLTAKKLSLAGAAGTGILLTNYPNDGEIPFGQAMLLYVALHEAFHQFAMNYPEQPTWVSESLASYYGVRAMQIALPNDPGSTALLEKFLANAEHFKNGLVTINRKVQQGDQSEYAAFYTKGIAFWRAVDDILKQKQDSLDKHLLSALKTKYDAGGEPIDLQKNLGIMADPWEKLHHRFLD